VNSLPETVTRQCRNCDLNPGPSLPESSTLSTQLPSHPLLAGIGSDRLQCSSFAAVLSVGGCTEREFGDEACMLRIFYSPHCLSLPFNHDSDWFQCQQFRKRFLSFATSSSCHISVVYDERLRGNQCLPRTSEG